MQEAERPCRNMFVSLSAFEEWSTGVRFLCEAVLQLHWPLNSTQLVAVNQKAQIRKGSQVAKYWGDNYLDSSNIFWFSESYQCYQSFRRIDNAIKSITRNTKKFSFSSYQQDRLKLAGNFPAAWRIPVKIINEKFIKLPAHLRLNRHSNSKVTLIDNEDSCQLFNYPQVNIDFINSRILIRSLLGDSPSETGWNWKKRAKNSMNEVAVMWMLIFQKSGFEDKGIF